MRRGPLRKRAREIRATDPGRQRTLGFVSEIVGRHLRAAAQEVRATIPAEELEAILTSGDVGQRDALCSLLGDLSMEEHAGALMRVLGKDESPCVRHEAAFALGRIGVGARTRTALERAALCDPSVLVRHEAVLALAGFVGARETIRVALTDKSEDVRESAVVAQAQADRGATK
jgi:HEAT repeat protein